LSAFALARSPPAARQSSASSEERKGDGGPVGAPAAVPTPLLPTGRRARPGLAPPRRRPRRAPNWRRRRARRAGSGRGGARAGRLCSPQRSGEEETIVLVQERTTEEVSEESGAAPAARPLDAARRRRASSSLCVWESEGNRASPARCAVGSPAPRALLRWRWLPSSRSHLDFYFDLLVSGPSECGARWW
ncbi:unnamed protein product, partial [Urochloa humidicola]